MRMTAISVFALSAWSPERVHAPVGAPRWRPIHWRLLVHVRVQAVRLRVEDLHDHPVRPKLMMPKSAKGGGRNRSEKKMERYSVPITVQLAARLREASKGHADHAPLLLQSEGNPWGDNRRCTSSGLKHRWHCPAAFIRPNSSNNTLAKVKEQVGPSAAGNTREAEIADCSLWQSVDGTRSPITSCRKVLTPSLICWRPPWRLHGARQRIQQLRQLCHVPPSDRPIHRQLRL